MEASKAVYKQIIGEEPKGTEDPKAIEKMFPKSMDEALNYARIHNYDLNAAKHNLKAKNMMSKPIRGICCRL